MSSISSPSSAQYSCVPSSSSASAFFTLEKDRLRPPAVGVDAAMRSGASPADPRRAATNCAVRGNQRLRRLPRTRVVFTLAKRSESDVSGEFSSVTWSAWSRGTTTFMEFGARPDTFVS